MCVQKHGLEETYTPGGDLEKELPVERVSGHPCEIFVDDVQSSVEIVHVRKADPVRSSRGMK